MTRPTNEELTAQLRDMATHAFAAAIPEADRARVLAMTLDWRKDLWRLAKQVDDRLCPKPPRQHEEIEEPPVAVEPPAPKVRVRHRPS